MKWLRRILFAIHLLAYAIAFMAVAFSNSYIWQQMQAAVFILMLWTPLMLVHVALFYRGSGHGDARQLERQAYRDGYQDAMRQLADHSYERRQRIALDDEGELVEVPVKRKRDV